MANLDDGGEGKVEGKADEDDGWTETAESEPSSLALPPLPSSPLLDGDDADDGTRYEDEGTGDEDENTVDVDGNAGEGSLAVGKVNVGNEIEPSSPSISEFDTDEGTSGLDHGKIYMDSERVNTDSEQVASTTKLELSSSRSDNGTVSADSDHGAVSAGSEQVASTPFRSPPFPAAVSLPTSPQPNDDNKAVSAGSSGVASTPSRSPSPSPTSPTAHERAAANKAAQDAYYDTTAQLLSPSRFLFSSSKSWYTWNKADILRM